MSQIKWIVDRIEENIAVVEVSGNGMMNVPMHALPPSTKEGDCLLVSIDIQETAERKESIHDKMMRLMSRGNKSH